MESFLIETPKWSALVDISDNIIVATGSSLSWARGKHEDVLWKWLVKALGVNGYTKTRQENIEFNG